MKPKRSEAIEAERSILGAILIKPDLFPSCSLAAEDFGQDRERTIFAAMAKLDNEGARVDLVTVKNELTQSAHLSLAGGVAYVAALTDGVPTISAQSLAGWEEVVKGAAKVRRVEAAFSVGLESLRANGDAASAIECHGGIEFFPVPIVLGAGLPCR